MSDEKEIKLVKEQIIKQIDSWKASDEQKEAAKEQIRNMDSKQLEQFLVKNKLIQGEGCVFCAIAEGKISAFKIDESQNYLAVLEINPISKGHTIVIPKKHLISDKLTDEAVDFAEKISKKLEKKLKPKKVEISTQDFQGHAILNIIPVYKEMQGKRKKAPEAELKELQEKILSEEPEEEEEPKEKEKKPTKPKKLPKAPRRIP